MDDAGALPAEPLTDFVLGNLSKCESPLAF